jgi:ABC-type uncharacterized transport system substrate-binding protein
MRRRQFMLVTAAAAVVNAPSVAIAHVARIGLVIAGPRQAGKDLLNAFRDGLRALGWSEGANVAIVDRWIEEAEQLPSIVRAVVASGVDLLVTGGTPATVAAVRATRTIPIVFVAAGDPFAIGAVNSLEHPGGNATGLSLGSNAVVGTRLQLLRELRPDLRRIAVIIRDDPGIEQTLLVIRSNANRLQIEPVEFEITTGRTVERAFRYLQNARCDSIYLASGPLGPAKRAEIITLAAESQLPAIYSFRIFALEGGLISYSADETDLFRRAAGFADLILKGADPGELPVQQPAKYELVVNLKAARTLALTVPQSLSRRADEVIE